MISNLYLRLIESGFKNRNSPIPCDLIADIELSPWASDSPALQVPEDLLRQSIQRAMVDIALRRANEKLLFQTSKSNSFAIHRSKLN